MMTSLYSEQIPVTEITSNWYKFHFPRDSRVITCVNLTLGRREREGIGNWKLGETPHDMPRKSHPLSASNPTSRTNSTQSSSL